MEHSSQECVAFINNEVTSGKMRNVLLRKDMEAYLYSLKISMSQKEKKKKTVEMF